jgi:hypothetical protein
VAGFMEICRAGRKEGRWLERFMSPVHWYAHGTQNMKGEWASFYQWVVGLILTSQMISAIRFTGLISPVTLVAGTGILRPEGKVNTCVDKQ